MLPSLLITTRGHTPTRLPLTIVTDGLICVAVAPPPEPSGGGSGRQTRSYEINSDKEMIEMLTIIFSSGVLD